MRKMCRLFRMSRALTLLLFLPAFVRAKAFESLEEDDVEEYYGERDDASASNKLIVPPPVLYDSEGNHVTFPSSQSQHANIRYRRDVGNAPHRPLPRYQTVLQIDDGDSIVVTLESLTALVAPSTRVEWTVGGVTKAEVVPQDCLYVSRVEDGAGNETLESVVNLCGGLTGVILTGTRELHIRPAKPGPDGTDPDQYVLWTADLDPGGPKAVDLDADTAFRHRSVLGRNPRRHSGRGHRRERRELFHWGERSMEVLLVIDKSVVRFHGRSVVQQYLITQLYLVNNVYHHPSLGVEIDVFLVKIHEIEDSVMNDMIVHGQGKKILRNFCDWVGDHVTDVRYDVAVYMTREDIGPAGYAHVTGMCNRNRSCAVIKDDGISSAFVIAHEIGHVFGMIHDGSENSCDQDAQDGKIMATMVQSNYHSYYWTECSRNVIEAVLEELHCLRDRPDDPLEQTYIQPYGQSWSLNEQCRQEFGAGYRLCTAFDHLNPCQFLWCSTEDKPLLCKSKRGPPLPGTSCGKGKWCMDEQCVLRNHVAQDGDWTAWTSWGDCSRSCDTGVQFRYRTCTNPPPKHGGKDCEGIKKRFQLCNPQKCPTPSDFRAEQCWQHNELTFTGRRRHRWFPHEHKEESKKCQLTCRSIETMDVFTTDSDVIDGTLCSYEQSSNICLRGKCLEFGCDGVEQSTAAEDLCGVCQGDNSTCRVVQKTFHRELAKTAYHRLLILPARARHVRIQESHSNAHLAHFLAVRELETERFLLNGKAKLSRGLKHFVIHGARFAYSKGGSGETLSATGPLLGPVEILVYSLSEVLPATIDYEYVVPLDMDIDNEVEVLDLPPLPVDRYLWQSTGIGSCSKTCGGGVQLEGFICVDQQKRHVSEGLCSHEDKPYAPDIPCNEQACNTISYDWETGEWQKCTTTCGIHGIQQRRVFCQANVYGKKNEVDAGYCHSDLMPEYTRGCNRMPCPAEWRASAWSQCSETCGSGIEKRAVMCAKPSDGNRYTCDHVQPPTDTRICSVKPCPGDSTLRPDTTSPKSQPTEPTTSTDAAVYPANDVTTTSQQAPKGIGQTDAPAQTSTEAMPSGATRAIPEESPLPTPRSEEAQFNAGQPSERTPAPPGESANGAESSSSDVAVDKAEMEGQAEPASGEDNAHSTTPRPGPGTGDVTKTPQPTKQTALQSTTSAGDTKDSVPTKKSHTESIVSVHPTKTALTKSSNKTRPTEKSQIKSSNLLHPTRKSPAKSRGSTYPTGESPTKSSNLPKSSRKSYSKSKPKKKKVPTATLR